jgi:hypothetical protein
VPARKLQLVLVVPESGLRSTIAARLALAGASVITVEDLRAPMVQRQAHRGAMLIVDETALAGDAGALRDDAPWSRAVVLTKTPGDRMSRDEWLVYLDRAAETDLLLGLLTAPM